jgi:DNA-binding NarL/FixJ family response regulator
MAVNKMLQEPARDGKKGKRARVLLADDHPAVAKELYALLQPEFDVIATVGDGDALLAADEALAPDVIVTDIAMPGLDGIAAASEILRRNPAARIVFVTVHDEAEMVKKGLAIGVLGYVLKLTAGEELVPAINAALRGMHHLPAWYGRTWGSSAGR